MPELTEPPELALGEFELSVAQLAEVWGADSDDEGVALLARIAQLPERVPAAGSHGHAGMDTRMRTRVWERRMHTLMHA